MSFIALLFVPPSYFFLFFFNDTATTEIYTLSLHDALPIFEYDRLSSLGVRFTQPPVSHGTVTTAVLEDRKSTRLNSSHTVISYAVFCLKKKKNRIVSRGQLSRQVHYQRNSSPVPA